MVSLLIFGRGIQGVPAPFPNLSYFTGILRGIQGVPAPFLQLIVFFRTGEALMVSLFLFSAYHVLQDWRGTRDAPAFLKLIIFITYLYFYSTYFTGLAMHS